MAYIVNITPSAEKDIEAAVEYYNSKAENLGYRFADLVGIYFDRIASFPAAAAIRYKDVRCKPMVTFPYLIMYTIEEDSLGVTILRIFNTWQEPLW